MHFGINTDATRDRSLFIFILVDASKNASHSRHSAITATSESFAAQLTDARLSSIRCSLTDNSTKISEITH